MLQCADVQQWQNQPNYLVLVDTRDRPKQLTTYVAQENLEVLQRIVVSQSVGLSLNCTVFVCHSHFDRSMQCQLGSQ